MDPSMQQQQQYYYAPGAPPHHAGYYAASGGGAGDANNGFVLPMQPSQQQQQQQQQMMYYAPTVATPGGGCAPPGYAAYPAPMFYPPPEAAFAAMSLSGQAMLPMQQTPGASSTTSNSSQPRAASTPIPSEEAPASLAAPAGCNPSMIPMHVMYTQMPQYYPPMGYDGQPQQQQQMMPMLYQDPTTGQILQHIPAPLHMQHMQQPQHPQQMHQQQPQHHQQQQQQMMANRMMSTDPDAAPDHIDDISQISHQSSPDSFLEAPLQRHPATPVSTNRRRISLPPPANQNGQQHPSIPNLMPSNYKTRMCTQWMEKRECTMGGNCKFAHGNAELRLPERPFRAINNPKYKTKMCKNFEPGASGLCAYAERCEYIHPTDREFIAYKARMEALARSRGDFTRFKTMLDEVPGANRARGGRSGHSTTGADDESRSVRSAESSCCADDSPPAAAAASLARTRRASMATGGGAAGGYLGGALPHAATRSTIRMGAGADAPQPRHYAPPQPLRRNGGTGGSMYNLASGGYGDEHQRSRLTRVPSACNVASLGHGGGGGGGRRYGGPAPSAAAPPPSKFNRRASMCHLNSAEYY